MFIYFFQELWLGLAHHVPNEHRWVQGSCPHESMEHNGTKQWFVKCSLAHEALKNIIGNERWLKEVHKYLNFR